MQRKFSRFDPRTNVKNRDLKISEIPNIDEVDGIYLVTSRGLLWSKNEPPDYMLMFCSADIQGIKYELSVLDFVGHFEKHI